MKLTVMYDGDEQADAGDGRDVDVDGCLVRVLADPRPGEELLDEDSAREHVREDEAEDGHDRRQRPAEDVASDDGPFGQPLGPRCPDVVVADHVEHGRAREACQQADVEGGKHERG